MTASCEDGEASAALVEGRTTTNTTEASASSMTTSLTFVNPAIVPKSIFGAVDAEPAFQRLRVDAEPFARCHFRPTQLLKRPSDIASL